MATQVLVPRPLATCLRPPSRAVVLLACQAQSVSTQTRFRPPALALYNSPSVRWNTVPAEGVPYLIFRARARARMRGFASVRAAGSEEAMTGRKSGPRGATLAALHALQCAPYASVAHYRSIPLPRPL